MQAIREKYPDFLTTQSSMTIHLDFYGKGKQTCSSFKPLLFGTACWSLYLNLTLTDTMIQPNSQ